MAPRRTAKPGDQPIGSGTAVDPGRRKSSCYPTTGNYQAFVGNMTEPRGPTRGHYVLRRGQGLPLFPLHNRNASVATLRWCSGSSRNHRGLSARLRRNPRSSPDALQAVIFAETPDICFPIRDIGPVLPEADACQHSFFSACGTVEIFLADCVTD